MPRSYRKNILRTFRSTKSRFIAIFSIVALGVGFLAGLMSTTPDMRDSMERYLDDAHMYDLRVVSTLGLTEEDAQALAALPGVEQVQPAWSVDLLMQAGEDTLVTRVHSLPVGEGGDPADPDVLDRLELVDGRWPQAQGECVVEATPSLLSRGCKVGDVFVPSADNEDLSSSLPGRSFTVVGLVRSACYFSIEREPASVGNGTLALILYVLPQDFAYDTYTEIYLGAAGAAPLASLGEEYGAVVQDASDQVEGIADARCQARYEQVRADAQEQLDDGWQEYRDGETTARQELADAARQLADARAELEEGEARLAEGEKEYRDGEQALADNEQRLAQARAQLQDGRAQLAQAQAQYDAGMAELEANRPALEEGEALYREGLQSLADALDEAGLTVTVEQLDGLIGQLAALPEEEIPEDDGELLRLILELIGGGPAEPQPDAAAIRAFLQALLDYLEALPPLPSIATPESGSTPGAGGREELEQRIRDLLALDDEELVDQASQLLEELRDLPEGLLPEGLQTLLDQLADEGGDILEDLAPEQRAQLKELTDGIRELVAARRQLDEGRAQLAAGEAQLAAAKAQLDEGWAQLAQNEALLAEGVRQLDEGRAQLRAAARELEDGRRELEDGRRELEDGEAEYEEAKAEAEQQLADARAELEDAERQLAELKEPTWYVWDRDANTSFHSFDGNVSKVEAIARVFPIFFFLVAALVVSTTMTRMVEEERLQIGALKAMGYGRRTIMKKYIWYALTAAVLGALAGLALGFSVFPAVIWYAYEMMYYMPGLSTPWRANYALMAGGLLIGCALVATLSACQATLRETPASLMRPRAPKAGKRILLERIGFFWRRLPFTYKVTCRNLLRYKKRFWMTVIGVAGCTALLVAGFGISDSLNGIAIKQYGQIYRYDLLTAVTDPASLQSGPVHDYLFGGSAAIGQSLSTATELTTQTMEDGSHIEVYLMTPQDADAFGAFVDLHERVGGRPTPLTEDGVLLTEKLAETLHLQAGDTLTLENSNGRKGTFTVTGVCEHYVMNYVYLGPAAYQAGFGSAPEYNAAISLLTDDGEEARAAVSAALLDMDGVGALNFTTDQRDAVLNMLNSINAVVVLIIVCAASLALVVLYNLTNINIAERVKEIATIKVLGFYDREVNAYVNRESVALTLIGALLGLVGGIGLHKFVIYTVEVDAVMFGRTIQPLSFVYAMALTLLFSAIVDVVMGRKLKKISMVESLKAPE